MTFEILTRPARWLLAVFLMTGLPHPVFAQNAFEKLVMPGKLIEAHAKLESQCTNCHSPFSQKAQIGLCLACHKDVAADIDTKKGMHGLSKNVAAKECRSCHAEHKGREADLVQLDAATFNHASTNFPLVGRHAGVSCESCHKSGKKFRAAPGVCVDCHRSAEPHGGQLGRECATCHNPKSWTEIKGFDHGKTRFALTGRHTEAACKSCHSGERYKPLTTACADCHRQQDIHQGRNGTKCDSCHKTTGWRDAGFDHDRQTKFPLLGKHQPLACEKCHKEDAHRVHLEVTCISCHEKDDKHKGQLGKDCLKCHSEANWTTDTKFDHALTRFPLLGKHAKAACEECHQTKAYKDAPLACSGCHTDKTTHDGRLGANCGKCHGVSEWKPGRFDHSQTHFKLSGRHATGTCYSCHYTRNAAKVALPTDCYSCHKKQDQHHGLFGRDCGKCHTPSTFSSAYIRK